MTRRASNSKLFINVLMTLYWCFHLDPVAERLLHQENVLPTQIYQELTAAIERFRQKLPDVKNWVDLPMEATGMNRAFILYMISCACTGSRSAPLCETEGSVQMFRLKQHGLRSPCVSFEQATSIRCLRVSGCLVALIQRIQSQRALGVIFIQRACACGTARSAFFTSAGTSGSTHSFVGSISSVTVSPASARMASRMLLSTLNQ